MECPYCKEEIKEGAQKCKVCGEFLIRDRNRFWKLPDALNVLLAILVPLASLGFAFIEFQAREQAVDDKEMVEMDRELTVTAWRDVLGEIKEETAQLNDPSTYTTIVENAAMKLEPGEEPDSPKSIGIALLQEGEPREAIQHFRDAIEEDPTDIVARKGLIYSQTIIGSN